MKKFLLTTGIALGLSFASQAAVLTTNWTDQSGHPAFLLTTNRASVYNLQLLAPANNALTILMYDNDTLATPYFGTNYSNAANTYFTTYSTSIVSSFTGANGFTNFYTNKGLFVQSNWQTATAFTLPVIGSWTVPAGAAITVNADMLFTRGISILPSTNGTIVVNYR